MTKCIDARKRAILSERHRILIVDDDYQDRQAVIHALRREVAGIDSVNAEVLEADTVAHAREALRDEDFACVFIDHDLPDGTALDLLTEIRTQVLATPVIVLTGQRDEQAIVELMSAARQTTFRKKGFTPTSSRVPCAPRCGFCRRSVKSRPF